MANERIRDPRCETCVFRRLQKLNRKAEKSRADGCYYIRSNPLAKPAAMTRVLTSATTAGVGMERLRVQERSQSYYIDSFRVNQEIYFGAENELQVNTGGAC